MTNTNGHGPKTAILYARVSTERQAREGNSLRQQIEVLREHATREGYEVFEEIRDEGWSGAYLERPGLHRVREIVRAGGVGVVFAQERDRFAREPELQGALERYFAEYGCRMRAINDRGEDSPEGRLTTGVLAQIARFEREKTAEKANRNKLDIARQGKLLAGRIPDFGYSYTADRKHYEVDEENMPTVRRIFEMIGKDGAGIKAVKFAFDREGVPLPPAQLPKNGPKGVRRWNKSFVRSIVLDDVYKPHDRAEVQGLVAEGLMRPEVAALAPEPCGIKWHNRMRTSRRPVFEEGANGETHRKRSKTEKRPRGEWIAVPVPDAGIPREVFDAARKAVENNRPTSSAGRRFWELSGGILFCAECGRRMACHAVTSGRTESNGQPRKQRRYHYYMCSTVMDHGKDACPHSKGIRAEPLENAVWKFVAEKLNDPEQIVEGVERLMDRERARLQSDPERERHGWETRLAEIDQQMERARAVALDELLAEGLLDRETVRARLAELAESRRVAERELEACRGRGERLRALETLRDAYSGDLLRHAFADQPDAPVAEIQERMMQTTREKRRERVLDEYTPEQRHERYREIGLRLDSHPDGTIVASGIFPAEFLELRIGTQTLVPRRDGEGRAVACEVLVPTPGVRNLIREGKNHQIYSAMQTGGKFGMQTMEVALVDLVRRGLVSGKEAQKRSSNPGELKRLANGYAEADR